MLWTIQSNIVMYFFWISSGNQCWWCCFCCSLFEGEYFDFIKGFLLIFVTLVAWNETASEHMRQVKHAAALPAPSSLQSKERVTFTVYKRKRKKLKRRKKFFVHIFKEWKIVVCFLKNSWMFVVFCYFERKLNSQFVSNPSPHQPPLNRW